jgi:hypothetical protein
MHCRGNWLRVEKFQAEGFLGLEVWRHLVLRGGNIHMVCPEGHDANVQCLLQLGERKIILALLGENHAEILYRVGNLRESGFGISISSQVKCIINSTEFGISISKVYAQHSDPRCSQVASHA